MGDSLEILKLSGPHDHIEQLSKNEVNFNWVGCTSASDGSKQYLVDREGSLLTFDLSEEKLNKEEHKFRN